MPFTVREFHDFIKILEERSEWRVELRRLMLTEELLQLPEIVRELAEAQRRTEERLEVLTSRVDALAEAQRRTEERLEALAEAQRKTEETVRTLVIEVGELKGEALERRYRERAFSYFGRIVKRSHALSSDELSELVDGGIEDGVLSREEGEEIAQSDAVVSGRRWEDGMEVYLVVEVSWGIGVSDVERAVKRAGLFGKLGVSAIPVVGGRWISEEAERFADESKVWQVVYGRVVAPI